MVRPEVWPLQACQVHTGGDVFINRRGAFGMASAAYWWGRMAAAVQRSGFCILGPLLPLWAMLFADDWNLTAEGKEFARAIFAFICWLVFLGAP